MCHTKPEGGPPVSLSPMTTYTLNQYSQLHSFSILQHYMDHNNLVKFTHITKEKLQLHKSTKGMLT